MIETMSEIATATCQVQMVRGEWPKPLDRHVWKDGRMIVSMLLRSPFYRAEAHYEGTKTYRQIGSMFLVPPDRALIGRGTGGKFKAIRCVFDPGAFAETLAASRLDGEQLSRSLDIGTNTTRLLMNRLIQEVAAPGFAAEMLAESIGATILVESLRQLTGADGTDEKSSTGRLQQRHLRMIDDYLDDFESGAPSIGEIARLCGFNTHYFCKLFRRQMGQSLGRYLADARLRRAESLLAETDLPLKEVAFRVGFSNAANFSNAFRARRNQTPGAYRQEMHARIVSVRLN